MHRRSFHRVAGTMAAAALLGFFSLPTSGAFSELNAKDSKQYISDTGLVQLYDNIVTHSTTTDGVVGVGIIHLETGRELYLNRNERFPMASSVKLPVAVHLMKLVDEGKTRLDSLIAIKSTDFSPGSGRIKYQAASGQRLSLKYLMEKMLTISDNTATDLIFKAVGGPASVSSSIKASGIQGMSVDRPIYLMLSNCWGVTSLKENDPYSIQILDKLLSRVPREKRIEARRNFINDFRDTSTPEAMARLLQKVWIGDILSQQSSNLVLDIMGRSHGNSRIKGLLPPGTKVYHKTGTILGGLSDCGIVELPNRAGHLVVVVFVKGGNKSIHQSETVMALIAKDAFDYFLNIQAD